ncbi:MAG: zinc-binding dehydrogenase, partial [Micromonosporaceae bacterium]
VPERNVLLLPDSVSDATGALLTDAGAVSFHTIRRLRPQPGDSIVVVGVGGLGHCTLRYLSLIKGLTVIAVDRDPERLAAATAAGAHYTVVANGADTGERVREITAGRGADYAIDHSASASGVETAFDCVRLRGTVAVTSCDAGTFALPLSRFSLGEYTVVGSHAASRGELETALDLAARGHVRFDDMVTHRLRLSDLPHALDLLAGRTRPTGSPPIRMLITDFAS